MPAQRAWPCAMAGGSSHIRGMNKCCLAIYPLVNCQQKLWKDPPYLMGKLTINGNYQFRTEPLV
jgi:hypothetical protein